MAARDPKTGLLALGLVNFSPRTPVSVRLHFSGAQAAGAAAGLRIDGPELGASNVPGKPATVTTMPLAEPVPVEKPFLLPPHTITVLTIGTAK